jgi:cytidylate kinase
VGRKRLVIAIDGPAASGKSTTAKLAADRLGYLYVDTGAMYRAITLKVLRSGLSWDDHLAVAQLLRSTRVELRKTNARLEVLLDSEVVTDDIRGPDVTRVVSTISSFREVRAAMVREQRLLGKDGGVVLDGRDIGTVVFPNADLKFFMVAGIESRATRRQKELQEKGIDTPLHSLRNEIEERDRLDSTRAESPLKMAPDAILIDTSSLTIEEQVDIVVGKAELLLKEHSA